MQGVPGTAQGYRYTGEIGLRANRAQEQALVHDNVDSSLAAISVGGTVAGAGVWLFRPETSGLINWEFSEIIADGKTHCCQGAMSDEGGQTPAKIPGRLLVALKSGAEMLVEQQAGGCSGGPAFVDPVVYKR